LGETFDDGEPLASLAMPSGPFLGVLQRVLLSASFFANYPNTAGGTISRVTLVPADLSLFALKV